jgi:hypothetical protein
VGPYTTGSDPGSEDHQPADGGEWRQPARKYIKLHCGIDDVKFSAGIGISQQLQVANEVYVALRTSEAESVLHMYICLMSYPPKGVRLCIVMVSVKVIGHVDSRSAASLGSRSNTASFTFNHYSWCQVRVAGCRLQITRSDRPPSTDGSRLDTMPFAFDRYSRMHGRRLHSAPVSPLRTRSHPQRVDRA